MNRMQKIWRFFLMAWFFFSSKKFFTRKLNYSENELACCSPNDANAISSYLRVWWEFKLINPLDEMVYLPKKGAPNIEKHFGNDKILRLLNQGIYLHEGRFCPQGKNPEFCMASNWLGYCPIKCGAKDTKKCKPYLSWNYR